MNVGGESDANLFAAAVRSALSKVSKFQLNGDISGTLQDYKLSISSDLDKVLKNAVSSVVREQSAKLEQQLKAAIQERTGGQLKELQASFGGLNQQGIKLDTHSEPVERAFAGGDQVSRRGREAEAAVGEKGRFIMRVQEKNH